MDLGLDGRIGLVTGASAGIGRGIAKVLAAEGLHVVVVARRGELLESLADEIEATGALRPMVLAEDLTDPDAITRIHEAVMGRFGCLDVLVNNAGASSSWYRGKLADPDAWGDLDIDEDAWRAAFAINFDYVRRLSHAFLPGMIERRWGRIILIGGIPEPHRMSLGLAAKAAGRAWMKGLSREVAHHGVTLNAVPVGRIMSEQIVEKAYPTQADLDRVAATIPMRRLGLPEEVGETVAFLASERSTYVTGQGLAVDGGMSMFAFY